MRGAHHTALTIIFLVAASSQLPAQSRIPWVSSWPEASALARSHQQLVLIHFWSNNCPPCLKLEQAVFNRPEVIRSITSSYVPLKVNVDMTPQLADYYRVTQWPTDVIVTPEGAEIFRSPSSQDPNRYIATLDQVAAHARVGSPIYGSPSTEVAAATRDSGLANRGSSFPLDVANTMPGTNPLAQTPGMEFQTPAGPATGYGEQSAQEFRTASTGDYAVPPRAVQPRPAATYVNNQFATAETQQELASSFPLPASDVSKPAAAGASSPFSAPNAERTPGGGLGNPSDIPAAGGRSQVANNAPAAPAGLALDGYCAVTLVEQEKWVKGDPQWGAIHQGRTYLFAGQGEQQRFLANYEKYAPALSGVDCVKYVEQGKLVDGHRAHGVFYRGQIFLFADEEALQRFWSAPEQFLPVVQAAQLRQASRRY